MYHTTLLTQVTTSPSYCLFHNNPTSLVTVVGPLSPTAEMSGTSIHDFATGRPAPNRTSTPRTRTFRPPKKAHKPGSRTRSPARCTTTPKDDQSKALSRKMLTASRIWRRTDGVPSHLDFVAYAESFPITSYEPISNEEDEHYRGKNGSRTGNLSSARVASEYSWLERKKATRSFGYLHTTQSTLSLALPESLPGGRVSSLTIDPNIYAIPEDSCTGPAPMPETVGSIRSPGDTYQVPSVRVWDRQGPTTKRTWTNWKRTRLPPGGHCPWTKEMLDKAWASLGGDISEETESEEGSKNGIRKSSKERFK